jgi:hypothetical protein
MAVIEARPYSIPPMPEVECSETQASVPTANVRTRHHRKAVGGWRSRQHARAQADRERRLAANLRALEREQAEREAASEPAGASINF